MSAAIASCAARLICSGAAKSGKPWERLTAPYWSARRVISRITDSVNCAAFAESRSLAATASVGRAGFIWRLRSVEFSVDRCIASDNFDVLARLGERNRIDKLGNFAIVLAFVPLRHTVFSGIVRGQRGFHTAEIFLQAGEV